MASDGFKQLHPASIAVNLVPRAWALVRSAWPLMLMVLYGGRSEDLGAGLLDLAMVAFFLLATLASTVIHFLTLRYRVSGGRLEIATGLLHRQVRVIAPDRIQNIEQVRNLFHRMSGLVEVRIETASGQEVEGMLSALSRVDANALVDALERERLKAAPHVTEEAEGPAVVSNGLYDLVRYGLTASRLGAAAVVVGLLMEGMRGADPEQIRAVTGGLGWVGGAALILLGVSGTWLLGTGTTLVRYWGFALVQRHGSLVAESGLITRRRVELPIDKVQLITVSEPWLRRMVGFGSLSIETAAVRPEGDGTQRAEAYAPVVEHAEFFQVLQRALPRLETDPWHAELRRPSPRALSYAMLLTVVRASLLSLVITAVLGWWGLLAWIAVPLSMLFTLLDYLAQGWLVTDTEVIARRGFLHRRTWVLSRDKLQAVFLAQGPLLRQWRLGQLWVRVAGSAVRLPDLGFDELKALQHQLTVERYVAPTPPTTMQGQVLARCQEALPGWLELTESDFDFAEPKGFSSFTMGIRCRVEAEPPAILYRHLQGKENAILDFAAERSVYLTLSEAGIAARCLDYQDSHRLEAFHVGRSLTAADLTEPDVLTGIAQQLHKLHQLQPEGLPEGTFFELLHAKWGPMAQRVLTEQRTAFPEEEQGLCDDLMALYGPESLERIRSLLPNSEPVFCHNDTYHGNVMKLDSGPIRLVDFEFSCRNHRAFDFSNLFAETVMQHGLAEAPHFRIGDPPYTHDHIRTLVEAYVDCDPWPSEHARTERIEQLVAHTLQMIPLSDFMYAMAALPLALEPIQKIRFLPYAHQRFARFLAATN